ncbi:hypothetical protein [Thauera phenylacetica]
MTISKRVTRRPSAARPSSSRVSSASSVLLHTTSQRVASGAASERAAPADGVRASQPPANTRLASTHSVAAAILGVEREGMENMGIASVREIGMNGLWPTFPPASSAVRVVRRRPGRQVLKTPTPWA